MYGIYESGAVIAKFAAPMQVRSNQPIFASDTLSLRRYVNKRPAQRWEIETSILPLTNDAHDLMVNMVTKGYTEKLQVLVPQNIGVIRTRVGTAPVTATGNINGTSITITSPSGLVPKGTYINFNGHVKVYMTTSDISAGGVVNIYPALQDTLSNATMYYQDDVFMDCYYDIETAIGMTFIDGILMDPGTIKLVEAV